MSARRRRVPFIPPQARPPEGAPAAAGTTLAIHSDQDIVSARQRGRTMAQQMGFSNSNLTLIATAISELARNMLLYASRGEVTLGPIENDGTPGIEVVA